MSKSDLYRQEQCADCHGYFYSDELRRDADGRLLCNSCRLHHLLRQRKRSRIPDISSTLWGVSLVEVIAVVLILGMLAGIAIPTIMRVRQKTLENELKQLLYLNQGTELVRVAEEAISGFQQEQSLAAIPELAEIKPEKLEQLEHKLRECLNFDNDDLRLGAAIKAITEWQQELGIDLFPSDDA